MAKKDFTDFDILKNKALSFFDDDHMQSVVSAEEQQKEINSLKETLKYERFFFVVDMLNFEICAAEGISKWLGYSENGFSLKGYWSHIVHPGCKKSLLLIAHQMYEALCKGAYELEFMVQRFVTLIPLKHQDGHYLLTKKTSSIFQYDNKNRLMAYLDEFTVIGNFTEGAIHPRIDNEAAEKEIMKKAHDTLLRMRIFSVRELQVMRKLAYNPNLTQVEIGNELDVTVNTINTYYKRFHQKARDFYSEDIPTVLDAAKRLRNDGLL